MEAERLKGALLGGFADFSFKAAFRAFMGISVVTLDFPGVLCLARGSQCLKAFAERFRKF